MKAVTLILNLLFISLTSQAGTRSAEIESQVKALAQLGYGYTSYSAKGTTAQELVTSFLQGYYHDGELETGYKEYSEMSWGDEVEQGLTSIASALQMKYFVIQWIESMVEDLDASEPEVLKAQKLVERVNRLWNPTIKSLAKSGAQFGFTGHGPGFCGISFITLLVIDVDAGVVYDVNLSEGGPC